MKVTFWFDPGCPFCWLTSRWVVDVAAERDLEIDWQPISLLLKNDPPADSPFYATLVRTHGMLRVVESVRTAGHADRIGDLYRELGRLVHHERNPDADLASLLESLGLDPAHAAALDDESFDTAIVTSMSDGLGLTGDDVGVPLIAIETDHGRVGAFGPVISTFPDHDTGLRLWDAFVTMISTPSFYELKRTRDGVPDLPPDAAI